MKRETVQSVTAWANRSFGPVSLDTQFQRALSELGELQALFDRERTVSLIKIAEEAADVVICLYRIIGMTDPFAIEKKMSVNRKRKWNIDKNGRAQHIEEGMLR